MSLYINIRMHAQLLYLSIALIPLYHSSASNLQVVTAKSSAFFSLFFNFALMGGSQSVEDGAVPMIKSIFDKDLPSGTFLGPTEVSAYTMCMYWCCIYVCLIVSASLYATIYM